MNLSQRWRCYLTAAFVFFTLPACDPLPLTVTDHKLSDEPDGKVLTVTLKSEPNTDVTVENDGQVLHTDRSGRAEYRVPLDRFTQDLRFRVGSGTSKRFTSLPRHKVFLELSFRPTANPNESALECRGYPSPCAGTFNASTGCLSVKAQAGAIITLGRARATVPPSGSTDLCLDLAPPAALGSFPVSSGALSRGLTRQQAQALDWSISVTLPTGETGSVVAQDEAAHEAALLRLLHSSSNSVGVREALATSPSAHGALVYDNDQGTWAVIGEARTLSEVARIAFIYKSTEEQNCGVYRSETKGETKGDTRVVIHRTISFHASAFDARSGKSLAKKTFAGDARCPSKAEVSTGSAVGYSSRGGASKEDALAWLVPRLR